MDFPMHCFRILKLSRSKIILKLGKLTPMSKLWILNLTFRSTIWVQRSNNCQNRILLPPKPS